MGRRLIVIVQSPGLLCDLKQCFSAVSGPTVYYLNALVPGCSLNLPGNWGRSDLSVRFSALFLLSASGHFTSDSRMWAELKYRCVSFEKNQIKSSDQERRALHLGNLILCIFVDNSICKSLIILNYSVSLQEIQTSTLKASYNEWKPYADSPQVLLSCRENPRFFASWITVIEGSAIYLHQKRILGLGQ